MYRHGMVSSLLSASSVNLLLVVLLLPFDFLTYVLQTGVVTRAAAAATAVSQPHDRRTKDADIQEEGDRGVWDDAVGRMLRSNNNHLSFGSATAITTEDDMRLVFGDTLTHEEIEMILLNQKTKTSRGEEECAQDHNHNQEKKNGGRGTCNADIHVTARALRSKYVDKHIRDMEAVINDPDCIEREFDASHPNFNIQEARDVFTKCRFLVLRNALDRQFMQEYSSNITEFVGGIYNQRINKFGKTSTGDPKWVRDVDGARWEVLLPKEHVHPTFVTNEHVLGILRDDRILGKDLALHHLSGLFATSGTEPGDWHKDEVFLESDSERSATDIPPYAIQVFSPMIDVTYDLGPTEFCIGTSFLFGLDESDIEEKMIDATLREKSSIYRRNVNYESNFESCPPDQWRTALLNMGDMVLSDSYSLTHRGGQNVSPGIRPVLAITYNRQPFKDTQSSEADPYDINIYDDDEFFGQGFMGDDTLDEPLVMNKILLRPRFSQPRRRMVVDDSSSGGEVGGGGSSDAGTRSSSSSSSAPPMLLEEYGKFLDETKCSDRGNISPSPSLSSEGGDAPRVEFLMTNMDVKPNGDDEDAAALLYVDGEEYGELVPRSSLLVSASPGSHVELRYSSSSAGGGDNRDKDVVVFGEWTVLPEQGQLIVTSQSMMMRNGTSSSASSSTSSSSPVEVPGQ